MNSTLHTWWARGLTVTLAALYGWIGLSGHGLDRIVSIAGALLIFTALIIARTSRPAAAVIVLLNRKAMLTRDGAATEVLNGGSVAQSDSAGAPGSRSEVASDAPTSGNTGAGGTIKAPGRIFRPLRTKEQKHRVAGCLGRDLLVRGVRRHVEVGPGDRHLPQVLPQDRDAVVGAQFGDA